MKDTEHIPVMYQECIDGLSIKPDGVYLDMTVGGFGHGSGICERLNESGIYIGLDLDSDAIERGRYQSDSYVAKCIFAHTNFNNFNSVLNENHISSIDGCLIDLGVSSFQIDDQARGFSFMKDGPLDMRMDQNQAISAYDVVNNYTEDQLKRILYDYGEEKFTGSIVRSIIRNRSNNPIRTTSELVEVVKQGIPKKFWFQGKNPATRTFQAIRIEVNHELDELFETISNVIDRLKKGGRVCIISFHSLEDRIVKQALKKKSEGCVCPKDLPVCVCDQKPQIKILTKKPILPQQKEVEENTRSRSAKLRIAEKIID